MTRFAPTNLDDLREAVESALAAEEPVELLAGGTKRGLGRPMQTPHLLDLSRLSGIRDYMPSELVLTAGAATPLAEIETALAEARQMLAFEPPDWRRLLGSEGEPTLGGVLATNLSGPRRFKAGAARDHFLGFRGVSGRGEVFKAGGKVVKNVTGYDLSKLMAGSWGTLAALEEVTLKVLPRPEAVATVLLRGLMPEAAGRRMGEALSSAHEVSGAAYLREGVEAAAMAGGTALRVEGPEASVRYRCERLIAELSGGRDASVLDADASAEFWRAVRDARPFAGLADKTVWRISVAPGRGAEIGVALQRELGASWYLDWGGGLVWAAIGDAEDGGAAAIRATIHAAGGSGLATMIRGSPGLRRAVPVFEPQPEPLAALSRRVKDAFDPRHILNPGRIVAGS
jgi:glycolate oxidase FAD binding subunit